MIALKYPEFVREGEYEDWEEEEQEDLPICFGDYDRYIDCIFRDFAIACSKVRAREDAAMADAFGLLED